MRSHCRYCHKLFTNLAQHERLHFASARVAYKCNYAGCTYACARNDSLLKHERLHTGERPFICDVCARAFTQKGHLAKHVRAKHAGGGNVARFRCQQCNLVWKCKVSLLKHLRDKHNIQLIKAKGYIYCCCCCYKSINNNKQIHHCYN